MTKENFKKILDRYKKADETVNKLNALGVDIWSKEGSIYDDFNYIIFKLMGEVFGECNNEIIEDFLFNQTNITFDEL